jgi:predicted FMN-binding regulatory protein PaiB
MRGGRCPLTSTLTSSDEPPNLTATPSLAFPVFVQGLALNHVPFLLDPSRGPPGTLIGHVARANTVWRELRTATPWVVMFQGPQDYITPGWYPSKVEHGKVAPTLEGRLKASQDETMQDRLGTVHGLREETSDEAGSMADLVVRAVEVEAAGRS